MWEVEVGDHMISCWGVCLPSTHHFPVGSPHKILGICRQNKRRIKGGLVKLHGGEGSFYSSIQTLLPIRLFPFIYICFVIIEKFNMLQIYNQMKQKSLLLHVKQASKFVKQCDVAIYCIHLMHRSVTWGTLGLFSIRKPIWYRLSVSINTII